MSAAQLYGFQKVYGAKRRFASRKALGIPYPENKKDLVGSPLCSGGLHNLAEDSQVILPEQLMVPGSGGGLQNGGLADSKRSEIIP